MLKIYQSLFFGSTSKYIEALNTYKGSLAQKSMHQFIEKKKKLQKMKETIDYQTINKMSSGKVTFREFVFQQKNNIKESIAPLQQQLQPVGFWTINQLKKYLGEDIKFGQDLNNSQIMDQKSKQLQKVVEKYYEIIGKKKYKFQIREQIKKIVELPQKQFQNFLDVVKSAIIKK